MKKKKIVLIVVASILAMGILQGCTSKKDVSLSEKYKEYFPIGAAVTPENIITYDSVLKKNFNSLTAENVMKFSEIHPTEDRYSFEKADAIVDYAMENNMLVRGHTLAWYNQVPSWVFKDNKEVASKELVLQRLEDHIKTVVGRYKGKVYCWDVVNEAIDDGPLTLRRSPWTEITGDEYIKNAFIWTHEADPEAELFYNDYNMVLPEKRDKAYEMIKELKEQGIPITGVGIQAHWTLNWPQISDIEAAIEKFASLGIKVQITELDMSYYSWDDESTKYSEPTEETSALQAQRYKEIFEVLRKHKDVISGVTFWGVTDDSSWLNYIPVKGRPNWPLLFDSELQPKEAYWSIVDFK